MASYAAVEGSVEVGDDGDDLDELLSEALDSVEAALDADGLGPKKKRERVRSMTRLEVADNDFAGLLPPPDWFAEDGWRGWVAQRAAPAAVLMAAGGACPIACAVARALCEPDRLRLNHVDTRAAAMVFALGLIMFWVCMVYQTLALPRLLQVGGPLAQLSLRNSGAVGFVDSHQPRLLAAENLRELRRVRLVLIIGSVVICTWFISVGIGSVESVLLSGDKPGYVAATTAEAFFPRPGCLSDTADAALRWWMALLYMPAGLAAMAFVHLCVLSQILAVGFAKQAIENVTMHLEFDRKLTKHADVADVLREGEETTLSEAIAGDPEGWENLVHTPLLSLVRLTLPLLSQWGPAIGAQTTGTLVLGMLTVPLCFATGGNPQLVILAALTTFPVIFLWGPAVVSEQCDKMLEHMNEVRADLAANAGTGPGSKVFALLRYASTYNRGQGIGFVMLNRTVNKRVLAKIFFSAFALTPIIQMLVAIGRSETELLQLAHELDEVERNLSLSTGVQGG